MTDATGPAAGGAAREAVVALDVGGTGIKCALVSVTGEVLHTERHATGADRGPDAVGETILDLAASLAGKARADGLAPVAVGLTVPGVVDEAGGVALWSANVGFRDVPLRDLVSARLGLPAALGHDVRAGGLAEARLGSGRDFRHVLFVAIGTGIAAAHVVDGKGFAGAHGAAGELGHIVVRPGGTPCGCGARGCLEAEASAAGVARRYAAAAGSAATAAEVVARAAGGDAVAVRVWTETIEVLADGLVTAQTLYDTEAMVLGGGLAEAGDALLGPLAVAIRERLRFQREPILVRAALGDEAGCVGAALLALDARA
ncbi:ROK family protein [Phytohabitans houttuyneae]|uniref:Sugar kinase n=2 Tax=Phytohabitans houttuyneae TaxID=1076126 RepID=A0A6V8KDS6_9ACTN|nr:ROK family protein [Phytohabitans houttuyneae]GFJ80259.1 sugar kinase [Phytohabitans houttuyneae]